MIVMGGEVTWQWLLGRSKPQNIPKLILKLHQKISGFFPQKTCEKNTWSRLRQLRHVCLVFEVIIQLHLSPGFSLYRMSPEQYWNLSTWGSAQRKIGSQQWHKISWGSIWRSDVGCWYRVCLLISWMKTRSVFFRKNFESYTVIYSYTVVVHGSMKSGFQLTCLFSQIFSSSHWPIS